MYVCIYNNIYIYIYIYIYTGCFEIRAPPPPQTKWKVMKFSAIAYLQVHYLKFLLSYFSLYISFIFRLSDGVRYSHG